MIEKINIYKDVQALNEGFTAFFKEESAKHDSFNISLSGGSTPKALFKYWASEYRDTLDWDKIIFFWGDERCVPPDNEMSNFGMTKKLLFSQVDSIVKKHIHRIHGENDPEEEIVWYTGIMNRFLLRENNYPVFDLMMLGLGDDGHTVSVFPDQINLWNYQADCILVKHPETGMRRISLTGNVVNNARNIAFLVTGKNKAEKVKQIIQEREAYMDRYPAARVIPIHGNLYWFLDEEAASLL